MIYKETDNGPAACSWHNGKMIRGTLTCCKETSFKKEGCKRGWHDGALYESIYSRRERVTEGNSSDDEDVHFTGSNESKGAHELAVGMMSKEFISVGGIDGVGGRRKSRRSSGALTALRALYDQYSHLK